MPKPLKLWLIAIGMLFSVGGCASGSKVLILDRNVDWVKLGPDVTGHVYTTEDGITWTLQKRKVHLPEGWVAGPGE